MAAHAEQIIHYLRDCYRENGSRGGIWNFLGHSVDHRVFLDDTDFLVSQPDADDPFYLRQEEARNAAQQAALYRKEKDLVYASIFVVGWVERFDGKPEAICAPLFYFPATLTVDGLPHGASLLIDPLRRRVNLAVLEAIGGAEFARTLEEETEASCLTEGCVGTVRRRFAAEFPDSETSDLLHYPRLHSGRELRKRFETVSKDPDSPLALIPAAAVALVKKSTEMRGVLNELDAMSRPGTSLSPPVRTLLGEVPASPPPPPPEGKVPVTLSAAQKRVLESARRHALTLAIGPPGTGKSFTIAALAIETLSRGGSVIIASKMDHAVDVVGEKIEKGIGLAGVVTRGGRSQYLRDLKQFIDELLGGAHTAEAPSAAEMKKKGRSLTAMERRIEREAERLEKRLARETRWGEWLADGRAGFFRDLRKQWVRRRLSKESFAWQDAGALQSLIESRHESAVKYLQDSRVHHLASSLQKNRGSLQHFSRAIRARTGQRQAEYFRQMSIRDLLGALPIWLVNLTDVHRILPLEAEVFDLAIIDEATQCDIASALPILQRARRAVITGDPKQLRHLSFLSRDRQQAIAQQWQFDQRQCDAFNFRDVSLLDLVSETITDQSQVAFLNEHFRSQPEIIAFSNREFYAGQLHVMTGHRRRAADPEPPLEINHHPTARRLADGSNPEEAAAIINAVAALCESQAKLPPDEVHQVGILSPFRDQVDHLRDLIMKHPMAGTLLDRHDLLVGTAHSFQGEERDLIYLSLTLDDDSPSTSFRFLNQPEVFNVAITRARLLNQVWHSFELSRPKADSLLARYLRQNGHESHPGEFSPPQAASGPHGAFAAEVADWLRQAGAEVTVGQPLAGTKVDLIYVLDGVSRGIDLIGYPGAMAGAFPLERVLTFHRAGLPILPLPYSAWLYQRGRCEAWLLSESTSMATGVAESPQSHENADVVQ